MVFRRNNMGIFMELGMMGNDESGWDAIKLMFDKGLFVDHC